MSSLFVGRTYFTKAFTQPPLEGKSSQEGEKMKYQERDLLILSCLRQDARMKLTDMSRVTRIPVSTLFDKVRDYKDRGLVEKYTSLVRFEKLGFKAKALIVLSAEKKDRARLLELLSRSRNVNSLFRVNNGWDFMAEGVFPGVREVEDFVESIEEQVSLKDKRVFYIIDELKKEEFLASPQKVLPLWQVKK